jgi:hypothetical protein
VLLLKEWKLIEGETIAIHSFKIRTQNSLKNNFNQRKIDRHVEYIDNKIVEYENQLNEANGIFEEQEITEKIDYQKEKKSKYKSIEKELNNTGQKQISKIDSDTRSVVLHRNIVNVGYNVQAGCDGKHKLFINAQTGSVNDTHALAPMVLKLKSF